jgi:hypothetical protein
MADQARSDTGDLVRGGLRCDFCGQQVTTVRRIALDRGYERLRTPHVERYACPACSEKKEKQRQGLDRG